MFQFSVTEMMIVITSVAVAAAGIAIPAEGNRVIAAIAAILIGFTIAGPPLLFWRRRNGKLPQRCGLGELSWFYLGLYFLPLPIWCVISHGKGGAERWLTAGFVMSSAICATAIVLGFGKLNLRVLGGYESSGRDWFNRRATNVVGLMIILVYTLGGIAVMLFGTSLGILR